MAASLACATKNHHPIQPIAAAATIAKMTRMD
jgi:hypothetical protein